MENNITVEHEPRQLAWMVLKESTLSQKTLDQTLEAFSLPLESLKKRDRALANALIHGTLRWKGHLDWIIAAFSRTKPEQVDPEVMWLLRMALFQIIHMDKIPTSAAVNTAVNVAKFHIHKGAAGFTNAVLRKAATHWQSVAPPDPDLTPELFVAVEKSIPLWLARRWITRFGMEKTMALGDAVNEIPPITLRVNTLKTCRDDLINALSSHAHRVWQTPYSSLGISLKKPSMPIHELPAFKAGEFQVQDEAAQLVTARFLDPQPGERILDACAGLGGKTGHIAQLMENRGTIVAGDTDPGKLNQLDQEMKRLGIDMVSTRKINLLKTETLDFNTHFHRVLVDAPCSGLGVLRRNPDTRWKRTKKDVARLAVRQEKMLFNAADLVAPGGTLVYAVCSCEPRENQTVIQNFLDRKKEFTIKVKAASPHDSGTPLPLSPQGMFCTWPDALEMDGFFAVALQRKKS
ncbi:16S rRNA (cytosine967-C5)-methyltransferase [Desulfocicer vacuolatum DSM 3385]|uniref:16S rRNA (cytosine(967)-C(5))-methyltransferase n=1 Tax=Desulfocicer vacuolatum DSM 3385 TaxID=1121400 RepID=A0A1W1ZF11_9BACT|nr:16S rRNA (cytosine(967)-C(5))-methyltransferase RsmB [Desulfocicer vacuolatum]SMC46802.1 16S rRNA (cytosine967-C5)-methyltransferase [Desulfocicer vacuolatum DSM 3385]